MLSKKASLYSVELLLYYSSQARQQVQAVEGNSWHIRKKSGPLTQWVGAHPAGPDSSKDSIGRDRE
ncbi:Hypothetical protein FKW44_024876 [Caligus rogercresseyi]|uniref:Uncharacterized protein n=1 Tax=Caligus rogercresseyi TaxID=217165 RepID=A0A7T8GMG0_CALRO|nr:Hypothetical protein FKW44_024876 [Caligus rogercresseyi]